MNRHQEPETTVSIAIGPTTMRTCPQHVEPVLMQRKLTARTPNTHPDKPATGENLSRKGPDCPWQAPLRDTHHFDRTPMVGRDRSSARNSIGAFIARPGRSGRQGEALPPPPSAPAGGTRSPSAPRSTHQRRTDNATGASTLYPQQRRARHELRTERMVTSAVRSYGISVGSSALPPPPGPRRQPRRHRRPGGSCPRTTPRRTGRRRCRRSRAHPACTGR